MARRTLGAFALVGTTAVVWFGFVDPAGAYAPTVKASCVGGQSVLTVEVRDYNGRVTNTVNVQDNQKVLDSRAFGTAYRNSFIRPGNVNHVYHVVVRAGNDRTGDQGFSFERSVPQPACAQSAPAPAAMQPQQWPNQRQFFPVMPSAPRTTTPTTTVPQETAKPVVTTTSTKVTTTTTEAHEPPGQTKTEETKTEETSSAALTTQFLPALVPPLVSLIEPPTAGTETTSTGSASTPTSPNRGNQGAATPRSTPSFPITTPEAATKSEEATKTHNVMVLADDTDLPTTGASVAIPLLFGLCMLTAGGVVVFSMRSPRKRGRHSA
ncbi:MAG: hypothetical protein ABIQ18_31285 [Umezawaea sp.]